MGAFSTLVLSPDVSCCLAEGEGKGEDYTTFTLEGTLTQLALALEEGVKSKTKGGVQLFFDNGCANLPAAATHNVQ